MSTLYLPRSKGGRGLLSFEHLNEHLLVDLCCYLTLSTGAYIQCVTTHEFERSVSNIFRWAVYETDSFKDQPVQVVGLTHSNRPDIVL